MAAIRDGKCDRKRKTNLRTDRKIVQTALKGRKTFCRNLSTALAVQGNISHVRRTVNDMVLESGLKAYWPRKKSPLTQPMITARLAWLRTTYNGLLNSGRWYKLYI